MAHNRNRAGRRPFVPTASFVRDLDAPSAESINGDHGGEWSPSSPIVIGGAGVLISEAGGFEGGVRTITSREAAGGALVLGDDAWPEFAPRSRVVLFPVHPENRTHLDFFGSSTSISYDDSVPGRLQALGTAFDVVVSLDPKRFPRGATITSVKVRLSVGQRPAAIPGSGVRPHIYFGPTLSFGAYDDAVLPAPASVDAYFLDGRPQNLVVIPAINTTVLAGVNYKLEITDASGTKNIYHSIEIAFDNITSMDPRV